MTDVALTSVAVTITLTEGATVSGTGSTILITVDPDPVALGGGASAVDIDWSLNASGWEFAKRGIVIQGPQTVFKRQGASKWKRAASKKDDNTYKYTINLENATTDAALTWDPFILNN
jgi:hypothetical protein